MPWRGGGGVASSQGDTPASYYSLRTTRGFYRVTSLSCYHKPHNDRGIILPRVLSILRSAAPSHQGLDHKDKKRLAFSLPRRHGGRHALLLIVGAHCKTSRNTARCSSQNEEVCCIYQIIPSCCSSPVLVQPSPHHTPPIMKNQLLPGRRSARTSCFTCLQHGNIFTRFSLPIPLSLPPYILLAP